MIKRFTHILCLLALFVSPVVGNAAAISPSTLDLTGARGNVIESSFVIINTGVNGQTYFLDLLAFEPSGEDATPLFDAQATVYSQVLSWITFPVSDVFVPALSKVTVPFTIAIPDDIPAGSYYGAITVSTTPSDVVASLGATIEAKTAILVFLTVQGETMEKLELLDFIFDPIGGTLPFGTFRYRLQNQGNVLLIPAGEIKLTGIFGQTIARSDANKTQGRVLPSSTRTYEVVLGPVNTSWFERAGYQLRYLLAGPITADLSLSYGQTGSITQQAIIWVVPVELMIILGVGLLIVLFLYRILLKR